MTIVEVGAPEEMSNPIEIDKGLRRLEVPIIEHLEELFDPNVTTATVERNSDPDPSMDEYVGLTIGEEDTRFIFGHRIGWDLLTPGISVFREAEEKALENGAGGKNGREIVYPHGTVTNAVKFVVSRVAETMKARTEAEEAALAA